MKPTLTSPILCSGSAVATALLLTLAPAAPAETWNLPVGGSWNAGGSWTPATIPNAIGANATFNNAASGSNPAQTGSATVNLDGTKTVGSMNFNNDAANALNYSVATGSGGPLVFDEVGSGPATITVPVNVGTGNNTISVATRLDDSLVVNVHQTNATSQAGALNLTTAISGTGGFTKQGDGLATFGTGTKTYTGATLVSGGRMRLSLAARPQSTSSLTINGGQLTILNPTTIVPQTFTFGPGLLNLNGAGPTTGTYAAFPGAIRCDTGNQSIINNAVVLQSDTVLHVQGTTAFLAFAAAVSGPGKLTVGAIPHDANLGTLVLVASNSYAGGTVVEAGTLFVTNATATLGTGDVTVNNSSASFGGANAKVSIDTSVVNAIADTATLSLAGGNAPGVADDGCIDLGAGVNETVAVLKLGGVTQAAGTYGSTASAATTQNDEYFSGPGIITVPGGAEPQPALTISRALPNVVLTWPTNFIGFTLQEVAVLNSVLNWSNVNTSVVISDTNNTVTVPATNINFFRVMK